ncbi:MAG TPA: T9SS type A sorting domain-containing protein [Ignavibacteriales bacterium]|nr:T9SS type A sorting domain-containing protein [Ignavibacteriales bacterium]
MKKIILFLLVVFSVPMKGQYISEILIDSVEWKIEFIIWGVSNLDDIYIKTSTDSVNFKKGIAYDTRIAVSARDLERELKLNPKSETIEMKKGIFRYWSFEYGTDDNFSQEPPKPGHSLCCRQVDLDGGQIYYHDATPTLGFMNDTMNITGSMTIKVINQRGEPRPGIKLQFADVPITLDTFITRNIYTDTDGFACINGVARLYPIYFFKDDAQIDKKRLVMYADTVVDYTIMINDPSISIDEEDYAVSEYALEQNYPNPFNPATTIKFSLPEAGNVKLSVYDITGRLIETLASGFYGAGNHTITFNANNISSGLYILRADLKAHVLTRKMILIK